MDVQGSGYGSCRRCSARLRPGDPWCSLCHAAIMDVGAELAPRSEPPQASPADLSGPAGSSRGGPGLVGGTVPAEVLAGFEAGLAELAGRQMFTGPGGMDRILGSVRSRPGIAATIGSVALLVVLMVAMTLAGFAL